MPEASTTEASAKQKAKSRQGPQFSADRVPDPASGLEGTVPQGLDLENGFPAEGNRDGRLPYGGRGYPGVSDGAGQASRSPTLAPSHNNPLVEPIVEHLWGLGRDFSPETFERHTSLLDDRSFSHPANREQRATVVRELQRTYGNQYVQRVVAHIASKRAQADEAGPEGTGEDSRGRPARRAGNGAAVPPAPVTPAQRQEDEDLAFLQRAIQRFDAIQQTPGGLSNQPEMYHPWEELLPGRDSHGGAGHGSRQRPSLPVQPNLTVGPAGDAAEQETDRVAKQVVGGMLASPGDEPLRRQYGQETELPAQPPAESRVGAEGGAVGPDVEQRIQQARGGGHPLPDSVRVPMERGFGRDFSGVRVHTGPEADALNRSVSARAFTTGADIFFRQGEYHPGSRAGKEVLAHELTHVVQQQGSPSFDAVARVIQRVDQHEGTSIPTSATQAAIHSELYPGRGPTGAPPVPWDGALTPGMSLGERIAALSARAQLTIKMTTALNASLASAMPAIRATAARRRLPIASLEGAGRAAKADVDAQFNAYATAAALTATQEADRAAYTISASGPDQNLFDAQDPGDRATVGMGINPADLASWMAGTVPDCVAARNAHHFDPTRSPEERTFLRTNIIMPFVATNDADLRAFDLHGFALSNPDTGQIVLPTSVPAGLSDVAPAAGGPSAAERGRKWRAWRTMVHEYIHQLEHPALREWPGRNRTISEGFCEYFTKKVLLPLLPTAAGTDAGRRTMIEGSDNGAPSAAIIGGDYNPGSYANYLARVEAIEGHLGGASVGAQNAMKAIFFQGHLEYLGYDTAGNPLTAPAGPQDQITVPASITTFAALAAATNVPEAELRAANPGAAEPLSGRLRAPGCREHRVVIAGRRGSGARGETLAVISTQHNVAPAALTAANPGVDFTALGEGDVVIIPRR